METRHKLPNKKRKERGDGVKVNLLLIHHTLPTDALFGEKPKSPWHTPYLTPYRYPQNEASMETAWMTLLTA